MSDEVYPTFRTKTGSARNEVRAAEVADTRHQCRPLTRFRNGEMCVDVQMKFDIAQRALHFA
jgi:hypothetical protein